MRTIQITFPNGCVAGAAVLDDREPALCANLWGFLQQETGFICHNTMSTGDSFAAFPRPTRSPNTSAHLANPIGRNLVAYTALQSGNILWSGNRLYVVYGRCTEPGLAGAVTLQVAPDHLAAFTQACHDVWTYTYRRHRVAVIHLCRGMG